MKKGDTIEFNDPEIMIDMMYNFNRDGIETDFLFEKDGRRGLWLVVTSIKKKTRDKQKS